MKRRAALRGLGVTGASLGMLQLAEAGIESASGDVRRHLRLLLTFRNPTSRLLHGQAYWGRLPIAVSASQRMVELHVSMPHQVRQEPLGHRVLELTFGEFAPLGHRTVSISVQMAMRHGPEGEALGPNHPWLAAQRFIESDDPAIAALAIELRQNAAMSTARSIYDWVSKNITYAGYVAEELGALHAIRHRRGDCTEFADLCAALGRACGIPSRRVSGFVLDRDAVPRASDYHDWTEFYFDGAWHLADAQKGHWQSPRERYIGFLVHGHTSESVVGLGDRYRIDGELEVVQ